MQTKKQRVLIIGYGEMGHAMQHLLRSRHDTTVWQRRPSNGKTVSLAQAATGKDVIIFCIPTGPLHRVATEIKSVLQPDMLVISIAKGLDDKGRPAFAALGDALDAASPRVVLYGPMISEEMRADRPGFAQIGSAQPDWAQKAKKLFSESGLYLTTTTDTTGISWCAVLKNVYALAFGMADELGLGDNVRGYLATVALQELAAIAQEKGGTAAAPYGLAGLGDLLTTATSVDSHHHELGKLLARGERDNLAGEGTHTIQLVNKLELIDTRRYPLMHFIEDIVLRGGDVRKKWHDHLQHAFTA